MIFGTLRTKICSFLRAPKLVGYKPRFLRDFFFFLPTTESHSACLRRKPTQKKADPRGWAFQSKGII